MVSRIRIQNYIEYKNKRFFFYKKIQKPGKTQIPYVWAYCYAFQGWLLVNYFREFEINVTPHSKNGSE